jgi:hypothetical protein
LVAGAERERDRKSIGQKFLLLTKPSFAKDSIFLICSLGLPHVGDLTYKSV